MLNWLKTAMLMAAIMALFGVVGGLFGGREGMLMALVFGGTMNIFSYWFSDKLVPRCTTPTKSTRRARHVFMPWCVSRRSGPICPCRAST